LCTAPEKNMVTTRRSLSQRNMASTDA